MTIEELLEEKRQMQNLLCAAEGDDLVAVLKRVLDDNHTDQYFDLLMQVGNVYPGETRHETAKRYIKSCEAPNLEPAKEA